ncbi:MULTISPECIES: AtzE family amidohydrolase [unclassified Acidisoma]|uniref:AtzE family amidohydrolase n=1 Tax=unclassified Acidisoma TaxID=2634065 RepID=UPI00131B3457|nr:MULTISPECIES: AtzE family amidohydrolase [unclassified Acidisoma]
MSAAVRDAVSVAKAVRDGTLRAETVARDALAEIASRDAALNCFTAVLEQRALKDARAVDEAVAAGRDPGPLAGVPFAVKNLFDVADLTTVAGSLILRDRPPATSDGALVRQMRQAGAVLVGATNMDEFAYGFVTENSHDGTTHNPHALEHVAGGSSGGSAAAVAAGLVPLSLGTDTNGSIRVPASFCGIFGLKPTYGRLSRAGSFPFVGSFDHVGPFARTVADLSLCYDALQTGHDPADPGSADRPIEPTLAELESSIDGLRCKVLGGWFMSGASAEMLAALGRVAEALGAAREVELSGAETARSAAFVITASEGGNLHLPDLRRRPDDFDPATRDRLMAGTLVPATAVLQAQRFRSLFRAQVAAIFEETDILLAPATPFSAPRIGQAMMVLNGVEIPARPNIGLYTQPLSFIGLPIVTVPVVTEGLPLGVQVIAPPWREGLALRVAHNLERAGVVRAK